MLQPRCFIIYMLTEVHWPLFYYHLLFQFTFMLLILPYIHIAVSGFLHICFFHIRLSQSSSDLRSDVYFVLFCIGLTGIADSESVLLWDFFFCNLTELFHRQPFRGNHLAQWSTVMAQLLCSSVQSAPPTSPRAARLWQNRNNTATNHRLFLHRERHCRSAPG